MSVAKRLSKQPIADQEQGGRKTSVGDTKMGASLKHKILIIWITLVAQVAFAGKRNFQALEAGLTATCVDCSFGPAETLPLRGQNNLLHNINVFAVDGKDPRETEARDGANAMFAAIGVVQTTNPIAIDPNGQGKKVITQATAFLISPCLIMTNRHAVFGSETPTSAANNPKDFSHYSVEFSVGSSGSLSGFKYKKIIARPVAWGSPIAGDSSTGDWAILQLPKDQCVGSDSSVGWLDLLATPADSIARSDLSIHGYSSDFNPSGSLDIKRLITQNHCHAHNLVAYSDQMTIDCATAHGDSGGPIIKMVAGVPKVVGMTVGSFADIKGLINKFSMPAANEMIPVAEIEIQIAKIYGGSTDRQVTRDVANHTDKSFVRPQAPTQTALNNI